MLNCAGSVCDAGSLDRLWINTAAAGPVAVAVHKRLLTLPEQSQDCCDCRQAPPTIISSPYQLNKQVVQSGEFISIK